MKDGVIVLDYKERISDINPVGTFIFQGYGKPARTRDLHVVAKMERVEVSESNGRNQSGNRFELGTDKLTLVCGPPRCLTEAGNATSRPAHQRHH